MSSWTTVCVIAWGTRPLVVIHVNMTIYSKLYGYVVYYIWWGARFHPKLWFDWLMGWMWFSCSFLTLTAVLQYVDLIYDPFLIPQKTTFKTTQLELWSVLGKILRSHLWQIVCQDTANAKDFEVKKKVRRVWVSHLKN